MALVVSPVEITLLVLVLIDFILAIYIWTQLAVATSIATLAHEALRRAVDSEIAVKALEKSTHTIHPVPIETPTGKAFKELEEKLMGLSPMGREDFTTDLERHGMQIDSDVDSLV